MPDETPPSLLSAGWVNKRVTHVLGQVDKILNRIIFDGFLSSGYLPFEEPVDAEMLKRMTPEQLVGLIQSQPTPEARMAILRQLDISLDSLYDALGIVQQREGT